MSYSVAPDGTKRTGTQPTHYHCYRWSGSGQEWERLGKTDSLDQHSPDRPPVRTVDWLIKSPRLIAATCSTPEDARDWLIAEWEHACERPLNPVPDWVSSSDRAERALQAIGSGCWPTYSQWIAGGTIVFMSVVGTAERCH